MHVDPECEPTVLGPWWPMVHFYTKLAAEAICATAHVHRLPERSLGSSAECGLHKQLRYTSQFAVNSCMIMEAEDSLDLSLLSDGESEGDAGASQPISSSRKRTADAAGLPDDGAAATTDEVAEHQQQQEGPSSSHQPQQQQPPKKKKQKKVLSEQRLKRIQEQHAKRGIVYISRIPPHMKPGKLRQLLSQYGEIGRIYCTPEDPAIRQQRKKKGGNTGKNFTEGWVEFEDKGVAKQVAAALNGHAIGGKKRSAYHFDLWNLKYLPKFKWDHLTEEIAYEKAVREQKLANELSAAKRERDFYLAQVDRAKAVKAISQRHAARTQAAADDAGAAPEAAKPSKPQQQQQQGSSGKGAPAAGQQAEPAAAVAGQSGRGAGPGALRHFGQRKAKHAAGGGGTDALPDQVLALVAGK